MKHYLIDDLATKYSVAKLSKIEDEIISLEKDLHMRKTILNIAETRNQAIEYWDNHTPEQRANFGKSQDEIENGYDAKYHSVIDFTNVSESKFQDLTEFWQALWLSGTTAFFTGSRTNTPKTQHEEVQN